MAVRLSKEEQYGIMALVDLAYNLGGGPAQVRQIAQRQNIPQRFLEQIFARLRQAKLVSGKRGPRGGYTLAVPATEIKLEDVLIALRPRAAERGKNADAKSLASLVDDIWTEVEVQFRGKLKELTLASMCDRAAVRGIEVKPQNKEDEML